jgi:endonuclease-3
MAQAVQSLRPGTRFGFGPPVDNGFYYDFDLPEPITVEDLPEIEKRMRKIIREKQPFVRTEMGADAAVARIAKLLGLTRQTDPEKIEQDLMRIVPKRRWTLFPHLLIHHGRAICVARKPRCDACPVADLCPSARV